jgi:hypothetical protein
MKNCFFITIILILTLTQCSKKKSTNPEPATVEDLMIKNNEISGWLKSGAGWFANGESELTTFIDGAAPEYIQNGFIEGSEQSYQGTIKLESVTLLLRIFDQGNETHTKNIFDILSSRLSSAEQLQLEYVQESRLERLPLAQTLLARKSKYLIKLTIESNYDEATTVLKIFLQNMASKIK